MVRYLNIYPISRPLQVQNPFIFEGKWVTRESIDQQKRYVLHRSYHAATTYAATVKKFGRKVEAIITPTRFIYPYDDES